MTGRWIEHETFRDVFDLMTGPKHFVMGIAIPAVQTPLMLIASCSRGALSRGVLRAEQDAAPARLDSQSSVREAGGHRPGQLRGSALNGWTLDRMKAGENPPDRGVPRPSCPGSTVPRIEIAADGAPHGDAFPSIARGKRNSTRCAVRRSMPLMMKGRDRKQPAQRAGTMPRGCLTIENVIRAAAH